MVGRYLKGVTLMLMGGVAGMWLPETCAQTVVEYIHTDALGSPVAKSNAAGAIIERSFFEPYGRELTHGAQDAPSFAGHVADASTGLDYMQQRYYDPDVGRFLSTDPVAAYDIPVGAFNRFKYASGNPYRYVDPDGRYDCTRNNAQCGTRDAKRAESYVRSAQKAHDRMSDGAAKDRLGLALQAIGTLNDGNGFSLNFTNLPPETLGIATLTGLNLDSSQIDTSASVLGVSASFVGATVVAHEESHRMDWNRPGFNRWYYPNSGLERMLSEIRAYGLGSAMGNAMGVNSALNFPGMSLRDRRAAIWDAATRSWESACAGNSGRSCSGYKP